MKIAFFSGPLFSCALALGCAHSSKDVLDLGIHDCLGRAISASMALDPSRLSKGELWQAHFQGYYNAYLDVREQRKYIQCLKKERPREYEARVRKAEGWLKMSEDQLKEHEAFFPGNQRIRDARQSFRDLDDQTALETVTVILRDGSEVVVESKFGRKPPAKP